MDIPPSFITMTHAFDQDFLVTYASRNQVLETAVSFVPILERAELAGYLDQLLEAGPEFCQDVWNRSKAQIFILHADDLVMLLRDIRARL